MALAISSLPVPLSPLINTVEREGATCVTRSSSVSISSLFARPDSPVSALETPFPSPVSSSSRPSLISDSSSMTRMEPLDMNCFPGGGQLNVEGRALARCRAHVNLSCVFFDDAVAYGKSEARAPPVALGGEEGIKDAANVFPRNPRAGVRDVHRDASVVGGL